MMDTTIEENLNTIIRNMQEDYDKLYDIKREYYKRLARLHENNKIMNEYLLNEYLVRL